MRYLKTTIETGNRFKNFIENYDENEGDQTLEIPVLRKELKDLLDNHWKKNRPSKMPVVVPAKKRKTQKTQTG